MLYRVRAGLWCAALLMIVTIVVGMRAGTPQRRSYAAAPKGTPTPVESFAAGLPTPSLSIGDKNVRILKDANINKTVAARVLPGFSDVPPYLRHWLGREVHTRPNGQWDGFEWLVGTPDPHEGLNSLTVSVVHELSFQQARKHLAGVYIEARTTDLDGEHKPWHPPGSLDGVRYFALLGHPDAGHWEMYMDAVFPVGRYANHVAATGRFTRREDTGQAMQMLNRYVEMLMDREGDNP